ncbi:Glycosyltransferase, GT2 family [Thalassovita litoralis]|uniref:Glycosyltransferase, GT2 family n=1 Tax=Thalassovita litoralis TaxID=1010611 RepID=A0A521AUQ9_9RHOB|nr:glycosyltransferase [Thalassovita litoralis]SMO38547.1 Glycosyltransferase, GT2 family [Thalassovita litoralis]
MKQLPVSVVVVSRGRPDSLRLCLIGLARLHHRNYEVIVVADPEGIAAAERLPFAPHLRLVPFDCANISEARNVGISVAGGDIVAFIDDDAVPEPAWLGHLEAAFHDPQVAAAGGFVIGRNGISWQWTARSVGPDGIAQPLQVDQDRTTVLTQRQGRAVKTEGTNMAVRRWVLKKLGGFDETFQFYMDETDLNLRLAAEGYATAIVPLAVVHHTYAPSSRRRADRAVLNLHDIGRSSAYFWRKHLPRGAHSLAKCHLIEEQRRRVMAQMRDGFLEPSEARRAFRTLQAGLQDGGAVTPNPQAPIARRGDAFRSFPTLASGRSVVLYGGPLKRSALVAKARDHAAQGDTVSLYVFSKTAVFHTVAFTPDGVWYQRGGLYGRSIRSAPLLRWATRSRRAMQEQERVARMRFFDPFIKQSGEGGESKSS